jgi:Ca2+-transporting ATPase
MYSTDGLTSAEAEKRLAESGYNELTPPRPRRLYEITLDVLREPMFMLLIAAGVIYLLLGEISDALMLLGFVLIIIAMTVFQAQKSARVLEALRELSSPRAKVLRDGKVQRIAGREVVPGDLLLLTEGDRVAADAVLLSCNDLMADESMLTGESAPVRKQSGSADSTNREPGGDDQPFVYAGTLLVQGSGIGSVTATGRHSAIGQIGQSLEATHPGKSPLHIQTARLVRRLALIAIALCIILILIYGYTRGHWLNALLAGITLAMSLLPEEFPVILSIFMSLGAWRISQHQVLTRRLDAIETLGAATVLCTDKTGTLTQNRMTIKKLYGNGQMLAVHDLTDLPEPWHELVEFGILASEKDPFDPMERALHELGNRTLGGSEHLHSDWKIVHEYSLAPEMPAMSHVWQSDDPSHHLVAAKGAPEAIIDLCHLPDDEATKINKIADAMADEGLRVLGVARASLLPGQQWPERQHDIEFRFVGLLGLQDPLRPDVADAVKQCHTAGIRVVMITGDHARTAQAIARELALPADQVLTGSELNTLTDAQLRAKLPEVQVFARIVPQQKLRLVEAFKANGEIVAMTGDGVNDAPALKSAHIGVAMGSRGTDVAREAAALVLLNDDFASLVATVRLGRRIYDNLLHAMSYTLAAHLPIVGMAMLPVLAGRTQLLMPAHIMFLELVIGPACSIFFEAEAEEKNIMQRPPRAASDALFSGRRLALSLLQGLSALGVAVAVYVWAGDMDENTVRALVFSAMVAGNLALVWSNRHGANTFMFIGGACTGRFPHPNPFPEGEGTNEALRDFHDNRSSAGTISNTRRNPLLIWIMLGTLSTLVLTLSVPPLRELFHFSGNLLHTLLIGLLAAIGTGLLSGWVKHAMRFHKSS